MGDRYNKSIISFFLGQHDSNISSCKGSDLFTLELERLFGNRYFSFEELKEEEQRQIFLLIKDTFKENKVPHSNFDIGLFSFCTSKETMGLAQEVFGVNKIYHKDELTSHHKAHASAAFYSSGFDKALVFSYDGGGNDGCFCVYDIDGADPNFSQLNAPDWIDFTSKYCTIGNFISEIHKSNTDNLQVHTNKMAGKVMGLSAFGEHNSDYYRQCLEFSKETGAYTYAIKSFFKELSYNELKDKASYDLAYSAQKAFEETFLERFTKFFNPDEHKNVCLTGGGALNVVLNERLSKTYPNTNFYVPSSPGDSGISYGMITHYRRSAVCKEVMYRGCNILDSNIIDDILSYRPWKQAIAKTIAKELKEGKLIGVCRGHSETGPRALGNRSILADPTSHQSKDIINSRVKFREWFRPFAPICTEESASEFFDTSDNVSYKYMSFSPSVREKYRKLLPAISHIDNSSRLQTVSGEQNSFIYDILKEFEKLSGFPVLVNTSFNIKGKAILTHYQAALQILDSTELDGVVLGDYYIYK